MTDLRPQDWAAFFSSTAQVSGGLVGLVFVALTFRPQALGGAGNDGLRRLARQTFADFLSVLLISLLLLVPYSGLQIGGMLTLIGGLGIRRIGASIWRIRRDSSANAGAARRQLMQRFTLSFFGNLATTLAGMGLLLDRITALNFWSLLFSSIMILLIAGSRTAWILLIHQTD